MIFDNKTILIIGLIIGGICALYVNQHDLAYAIFGGLIGYLSKDTLTVKHEESAPTVEEVESDNGSDETA